MRTAIFPVTIVPPTKFRVVFADHQDDIQNFIQRHDDAISVVYAGAIVDVPEERLEIIANSAHPAFEEYKIHMDYVLIFEWNASH